MLAELKMGLSLDGAIKRRLTPIFTLEVFFYQTLFLVGNSPCFHKKSSFIDTVFFILITHTAKYYWELIFC